VLFHRASSLALALIRVVQLRGSLWTSQHVVGSPLLVPAVNQLLKLLLLFQLLVRHLLLMETRLFENRGLLLRLRVETDRANLVEATASTS